MAKLALLNEQDLFETEIKEQQEPLPISLFQEIEAELSDHILHSGEEGDEIDGAIDFIKNIVENIKSEIELLVEDSNERKFLNTLSKIITILLSVKVDSADKILKVVKLIVSTVLKKMVRVNLVPKRVQKRVWPPREPYREFKIKTLLPEQKTV